MTTSDHVHEEEAPEVRDREPDPAAEARGGMDATGPLERGKKGSDAVGESRKLLGQIPWPPRACVARWPLSHVVEEPYMRRFHLSEGLGKQVAYVDSSLVDDALREHLRERPELVTVPSTPGGVDDTYQQPEVLARLRPRGQLLAADPRGLLSVRE